MFDHVTVLKQEAIEGLAIKPDGIYVDCTLGGAGHSEQIVTQLNIQGRLIAFDQDDWAHEHAKQRLAPYLDRVSLVKSNFRHLSEQLHQLGIQQVDGILFDLGVSSPQLDEGERGFSYNHDAPLDMRMDRTESLTASQIVNEWSDREIAKILSLYGEEKFARNIAKRFVEARKVEPIETTGQLVELIKQGIPAAARRTGGHPAKRTFQALRIAVNDELGAEESAIKQAIELLRIGGRLAVITFHSLEDRICKQLIAEQIERCSCPPDFPVCTCNHSSRLKNLTRKPIVPSEQEVQQNPRSRSAKLRIAEKILR